MSKSKVGSVLLALLGIVLAACASTSAGSAPAQRDYAKSLMFDGLTRTYRVHLPPAYNGTRAVPLVVALHGAGGDGQGMAALTHFNTVADRGGFMVVYPDGVNRRWAYGKLPALGGVDDPGFIVALIEQLAKDLKIDRSRIYATGISNGGGLVEVLACQHADLFASFADVAATVSPTLAHLCQPARPIPFMLIHGTDDPLVPYNGGDFKGTTLLSAPASAQVWASRDGCNATPATSDLPDKVNDGTHIQRTTYSGCKPGSQVIFYTVTGGGHAWPGGVQYLPESVVGKTSRQMDASQVIWEFFQKYARS